MRRIHMGSDSTLIAVASIPPHIWAQDKATWKAWLATSKASLTVKQQYKKAIADCYYLLEMPINQISEQHLQDYADLLRNEGKAKSTITHTMAPIRAYWKFARKQPQPTNA